MLCGQTEWRLLSTSRWPRVLGAAFVEGDALSPAASPNRPCRARRWGRRSSSEWWRPPSPRPRVSPGLCPPPAQRGPPPRSTARRCRLPDPQTPGSRGASLQTVAKAGSQRPGKTYSAPRQPRLQFSGRRRQRVANSAWAGGSWFGGTAGLLLQRSPLRFGCLCPIRRVRGEAPMRWG
jgi:hypothetical protein